MRALAEIPADRRRADWEKTVETAASGVAACLRRGVAHSWRMHTRLAALRSSIRELDGRSMNFLLLLR
jgi:hypothetical protein